MMEVILSISGKPGLYKLVSSSKVNLIVESIDEKRKRMPVFASDRVTSLGDIAIYTEEEDMPLYEVLIKIREHEAGKKVSIDWRKGNPAELIAYFGEVLPQFDRDRVRVSDIKKVLQWYDTLIGAGISNFEDGLPNAEKEEEEVADNK